MITKPAPLDPRDLRHAFSSFGTGVTVVTARHTRGRLAGVTANSFSSVSLDPPVVLWSLGCTSPSLEVFDDAGRFVINVLSVAQVALAKRFASRVPDKFAGVGFRMGTGGLPVLDDCAATIECRTITRTPVGDHVLFLGEVERYAYHRVAPLLFCQGHFVRGATLAVGAASLARISAP
jgi:flavin reductase (DIM6/NTAB) family NADH-FMN oxidoreductase RutF